MRRPTLDEWFNAYQHRRMWRERSFMTGFFSVDVTEVARDWEAQGEHPPWPAVLVKAAALAAVEVPRANRVYLKTLWGDRVVEFDGVHINMPLRFAHQDTHVLTAVVLRDADQRGTRALRDELLEHKRAGLDGTRITKLVATKPNRLWWRLLLRGLYFLAWRVPLMPRHGGAISVSCPAPGGRDSRPLWMGGPSPTSMLIALSAVRQEDDRVWLDLGVLADHLVLDGVEVGTFLHTFADFLEGTRGVEVLR